MNSAIPTPNVLYSPSAIPTPSGWRQSLPLALGMSAIAVVVTGLAVWTFTASDPAEPPAPTRLTIPRQGVDFRGVSVSSDGRTLVFAASAESGGRQLYRRQLGSLEATEIPGTQNADFPFLSPDGTSLGFVAGPVGGLQTSATVRTVSFDGRPSLTLAEDLPGFAGATWGPDHTVVYAFRDGLYRVSGNGGDPELVVHNPEGGVLMWPDMLPDGSAALVTLGSTSYNVADAQIGILTLAMGELELLFSGSYPRYSRSGHIVYHRDGSIWAAPFDVEQRRLTGEATPVVQGIWANGVLGRAFFALSDTGTLLYGPGTVTSAMSDTVPRTLVWVDRDGKEEPVVGLTPRSYVFPRLSPDERQIVVDDNGRNLWLYDVETQLETQFTFSGDDRYPIWSADGSEIIFASTRNGPLNLYSMAADRTGEITRLTDSPQLQTPYDWSADGQTLVGSSHECMQGE